MSYERTYYQRRKASKTMKKVWANRRRSAAQKRLVEERKAAGITTHTNGKPYRTEIVSGTQPLTRIEEIFGAGTRFKDLDEAQRKHYYKTNTARNTGRTFKSEPIQTENVIEKTLKPIQLLITVTVVGDPTEKMLGVGKMVSVARQ